MYVTCERRKLIRSYFMPYNNNIIIMIVMLIIVIELVILLQIIKVALFLSH